MYSMTRRVERFWNISPLTLYFVNLKHLYPHLIFYKWQSSQRSKKSFLYSLYQTWWHQITLALTTISCETQAMGTVRVMGWLICLDYLMSTLATGSNYYWDNLKIKRTRIILCFPKNVNKLRIFLYFQTSSNFSILQQWIALLHESLHTGYHMKGAVKLLIITITINSNVIGASFLTNHSVQL